MNYNLQSNMKGVSMHLFVKYIECFLKGMNYNMIKSIILEEPYTDGSCLSRLSKLKKIYIQKDTKKALEMIINSKHGSVSGQTKKEARKILNDMNNNKYPCIP